VVRRSDVVEWAGVGERACVVEWTRITGRTCVVERPFIGGDPGDLTKTPCAGVPG
jgi:hypothetical protein